MFSKMIFNFLILIFPLVIAKFQYLMKMQIDIGTNENDEYEINELNEIYEMYENGKYDNEINKIYENVFEDIYENEINENINQFCENLGYFISLDVYSYDFAQMTCNQIEKDLVIVTEENIYDITQALDFCIGNDINAWISAYYENPENECLILNTELDYLCTISSTFCDDKNYVVCQ